MVVIAIIAGSLIMGLWGILFAVPTVVVFKTTAGDFDARESCEFARMFLKWQACRLLFSIEQR
jgi:predicted PurR-regulated permease PerM